MSTTTNVQSERGITFEQIERDSYPDVSKENSKTDFEKSIAYINSASIKLITELKKIEDKYKTRFFDKEHFRDYTETEFTSLMSTFKDIDIVKQFKQEITDDNLEEYIRYVEFSELFQNRVEQFRISNDKKNEIEAIKIQLVQNEVNSDIEKEKNVLDKKEQEIYDRFEKGENVYDILDLTENQLEELGLIIEGGKGNRNLYTKDLEDEFRKFYSKISENFLSENERDIEAIYDKNIVNILKDIRQLDEEIPKLDPLLKSIFRGTMGKIFFIRFNKNILLRKKYEKMMFISIEAYNQEINDLKLFQKQKETLGIISSIERKVNINLID